MLSNLIRLCGACHSVPGEIRVIWTFAAGPKMERALSRRFLKPEQERPLHRLTASPKAALGYW